MSQDDPVTGPDAADALFEELAPVVHERSRPPADVVNAAKQLFTWRTIDAELARLTYDSLLDDGHAEIRSAGQPRTLVYEAAGLTLELEIDETPGHRRLLGQLEPAVPAELELRTIAGSPTTSRTDELGRFVLSLPPEPGQVSLRCVANDGRPVDMAWTVL
jgi:hypothetical protein